MNLGSEMGPSATKGMEAALGEVVGMKGFYLQMETLILSSSP